MATMTVYVTGETTLRVGNMASNIRGIIQDVGLTLSVQKTYPTEKVMFQIMEGCLHSRSVKTWPRQRHTYADFFRLQ